MIGLEASSLVLKHSLTLTAIKWTEERPTVKERRTGTGFLLSDVLRAVLRGRDEN